MTEDGNRHGSTVEVDPHYLVRWDDDPTSLVGGTHIKRLGPEVGDLFTGDDGPFIASLPDGTVVVNEDGNALLRCDGRWWTGGSAPGRRSTCGRHSPCSTSRRRWSDGG